VLFLRRASETNPTSTTTLDLLAEVEMAIGEIERAQLCWNRGLELSGDPNSVENTERWLYIAQTQEGDAARASYEQGISLLRKRLQSLKQLEGAESTGPSSLVNESSPEIVRAKLCTAHCALADLYLTDLCFEDGAEEKCQVILDAAMELNVAQSHEPLQSMASLRFSQGKPDEACQVSWSTKFRIRILSYQNRITLFMILISSDFFCLLNVV